MSYWNQFLSFVVGKPRQFCNQNLVQLLETNSVIVSPIHLFSLVLVDIVMSFDCCCVFRFTRSFLWTYRFLYGFQNISFSLHDSSASKILLA